jgi:hypothetical protein
MTRIQFWTGSAEGDLELGFWFIVIYAGAVVLAMAVAALADVLQAWWDRRRAARRPRRIRRAA